jgi:hypothetical protein
LEALAATRGFFFSMIGDAGRRGVGVDRQMPERIRDSDYATRVARAAADA